MLNAVYASRCSSFPAFRTYSGSKIIQCCIKKKCKKENLARRIFAIGSFVALHTSCDERERWQCLDVVIGDRDGFETCEGYLRLIVIVPGLLSADGGGFWQEMLFELSTFVQRSLVCRKQSLSAESCGAAISSYRSAMNLYKEVFSWNRKNWRELTWVHAHGSNRKWVHWMWFDEVDGDFGVTWSDRSVRSIKCVGCSILCEWKLSCCRRHGAVYQSYK